MEYLIIENNEHPSDWSDQESIKTYKYPLDYFQKYAVRAINKEHNFMACVATGSGKSTLADYAIAVSLSRGKRVIFTSPIKALSNQKYKEFKEAYGEKTVGLMTGDIKFNPDAPCIIMTAEILRNLLYKHKSFTKDLGITSTLSLLDVDTVIMDEVHYINNKERGHVWEETLIMLPSDIKLVLLSATIDQPEKLAKWIGQIKQKPIHLVSNTSRIIPLTHYLYKPTFYNDLGDDKGKQSALIPIMTNEGAWKTAVYDEWSKNFAKMFDMALEKGSDLYKKQAEKSYSNKNRLNNLIDYLKLCNLCPAICFVFSRKNCELYASSITEYLVSGKESAEIENIFHFYTHAYRTRLESLPQYYSILELLKKGVAYHHSGLIPVLKEVIEIIFSKGFIKVLFATETFSVGLNMPTKTVVFLEYQKPDASGNRMLYTDEYLQMAGRAGRRGIDTKGYVIYCPMRQPEKEIDIRMMMTGNKSPIISKMTFDFDFIFKSLHSQVYHWSQIVYNSYWFRQLLLHKDAIQNEIDQIDATEKQFNQTYTDLEISQLELRFKLENDMKNANKTNLKDKQRALDSWKNSHSLKKWDTMYNEWKNIDKLAYHKSTLVTECANCDNMEIFMGSYAKYLEDTGYLCNLPDKLVEMNHLNLTEKGILATEINEGNTILMSSLYMWYAEDFSRVPEPSELLAILTLFMTGDKIQIPIDEPNISNQSIDFITNEIIRLRKIADEYYLSLSEETWELNFGWYNVLLDWLDGKSVVEIVSNYSIYEGNLTKGMLKVSNLLEEWRSLASYRNDVNMLEHMDNIEQYLIRDIIIPDSLYVRN
jgi:superfamily II RNA helicase